MVDTGLVELYVSLTVIVEIRIRQSSILIRMRESQKTDGGSGEKIRDI